MARWTIPIACFLLNGVLLGWGTSAAILVVCSGIIAAVGLVITLSVWGDRLAQILFSSLSLAPIAGFWIGFLLHKVL